MKRPIRAVLRVPPLSEERLNAALKGARSAARERKERQHRLTWVAAVATAMLAVTLLVVGRVESTLLTEAGEVFERLKVPPGAPPSRVTFNEGSMIQVFGGAEVVALESSRQHHELLLRGGRAVFEVQPGGARRWSIDAGLARVEVVGTRFSVTRLANAVAVEVDRGAVLVRSDHLADGVVRVDAKARLQVRRPNPVAPATSLAPARVEPDVRRPAGVDARASSGRTRAKEAVPPERTRASAPAGVPSERARRAASASPEPRRSVAPAPPFEGNGAPGSEPRRLAAPPPRTPPGPRMKEDLPRPTFEAVDRARARAAFSEAAALLTAIADDEGRPKTERALAAFLLGRTYLEDLESPGRAATLFERALAWGLPAQLERSARARWVTSLDASGQRDVARRRAQDFLRRYSRATGDYPSIRSIAQR